MTIVVTGATGHLGRLVVEALLRRGARPEEVVATGRAVERISDLALRGVQVRAADYDDRESLRTALVDAEKLLLVSGTQPGVRVAQHQNVLEAAKRAGVELVVYTSIAHADTSTIELAEDHRATERALAESGLPYVLLRNSWYMENYTAQVSANVTHGAVLGSAKDGRISAATRADYADAAAAVLLEADHAGQVYELGGEAFTLTELAAAISASTGRPVTYRDLTRADHVQALVAAGLPEGVAAVLAEYDQGVARGDLHVTSGDLPRLIGRPATSMSEAVRAAASAAGLTG
jgi:NAD(P)H dehydrogenase (quinone)